MLWVGCQRSDARPDFDRVDPGWLKFSPDMTSAAWLHLSVRPSPITTFSKLQHHAFKENFEPIILAHHT